ncbi:major facilitator superfamily MFS_1 [Beutenbergia cavernae DSM 12333]|uniref:Major facilitator superfamily MFS_1 n=1 Tax=Beutenbergia cavernae (strain ATCC BAA-8 / DSM 12333 / CCUG 43141 / JCM 11478 / NBRC 16432 / NCIMB 13614 / HKI 0122) TaxID=471853 RepID=C5C0Y9_BEUC1|nr:MFS transporter [Beutenbergia cavernae]ACQ79393.1 major facilitator superfamily MFS_1 [Beutenbergia cavernae DSM 12333]
MSTQVTTAPDPTAAPAGVARRPWWAVVTLGLGILTLVTSEFLPSSLLSPIAADLGISDGTAGQLVTATAVAGILAGPVIVASLPPVDRRLVMVALTALSVGSNVVVALAPSLPLMLAGRALLGVALSGFWALSLSVVSRLVPAQRLGRAMTIVNTGVSLATVAAIPVGAFLGERAGWRAVFLGAAAVGVLTLVLQLTALPRILVDERSGLRPLLDTLRTPALALGFVGLALLVTGNFAAFTYLRPMLDGVGGMNAGLLAVVLAAYGVASFAGNVVAGVVGDRRLRALLVAVPLAVAASTAALGIAGDSLLVVVGTVVLWGLGAGAIPTMIQTWLARVAPDRLESGGGLIVATFQTSIALGAALGGLLVDAFDVDLAFLVAGLAAGLGALVFSRVRTG